MANHDDVFTCSTGFYKAVGIQLKPFLPTSDTSTLQFKAFIAQILTIDLLTTVFSAQYLVFCICYSFDLGLTLQNPLYPAAKRMRMYIFSAVIISILAILSEILVIANHPGKTVEEKILADPGFKNIYWEFVQIFLLIVFLVIGSYSSVKAISSLNEPGLGQEVRNKVIKRQISFVMLILIFNVPQSMISLFILVSTQVFNLNPEDEIFISKVYYVEHWYFTPF
jgi:hypothetical protein